MVYIWGSFRLFFSSSGPGPGSWIGQYGSSAGQDTCHQAWLPACPVYLVTWWNEGMTCAHCPPTSTHVLWHAHLHTDTDRHTDRQTPTLNKCNGKLELYLKAFFSVLRCSLSWFTKTSVWGDHWQHSAVRGAWMPCTRAHSGASGPVPAWLLFITSVVCSWWAGGRKWCGGANTFGRGVSGGDINHIWKIVTKQCLIFAFF